MAKKFIGTFVGSDGRLISAYGPIYGEWTEKKIAEMKIACKKKKAAYCVMDRVTNGHFIAFFTYDAKKDTIYREHAPHGYGPGLYSR